MNSINTEEQTQRNWICPNCSNPVPTTQDYCYKCGCYKPGTTDDVDNAEKGDNANTLLPEQTTVNSSHEASSRILQQIYKHKSAIAIALVIITAIVLFSVWWLNFRGTELTINNFDDYLTISLSGNLNSYEKDFFTYSTGADIYGSIQGVEGYKYEDVKVVIELNFFSTKGRIYVDLNLAGDALVNETIYFEEDHMYCRIKSYDVVGITGKVIPD